MGSCSGVSTFWLIYVFTNDNCCKRYLDLWAFEMTTGKVTEVSPMGVDNQSDFEGACQSKNVVGSAAGTVTVIAA
jgi:hypothetical protein